MGKNPLLVFDDVSVRYAYDKVDVFTGLSFSLGYGERLLLEMPVQGGKTSVVKLLGVLSSLMKEGSSTEALLWQKPLPQIGISPLYIRILP